MGFRPLVYGNIKSFLDPDPARAEMERWAARQGLSLAQTVSFTDGTKLQFEMALVANGLGARLAKPGMIGARDPDLAAGARLLAAAAGRAGGPIADYALYAGSPPGVFVVATRDDDGDRQALRNMRLGDGPHYLLVRPYHLCHLEIPRTVRRVLGGGGPLLDNGARPRFGVVAIAKVPLEPGRAIERGIGSFDVRGEARALDGARGLVPLGLLAGARLRRAVAPGQPLAFDDVELPPSRALELWRSLIP
jgi:predicted homoserine dehydrogenase-like protein